MFTSIDKCITAAIMSALSLGVLAGWWNVALDQAHVASIVGAVIAVAGAVWAVPNKVT